MKISIEGWKGSQVKAKKSLYKHTSYPLCMLVMTVNLDSNLNTTKRKGIKLPMEALEQRQQQASLQETTITCVIP